MNKLSLPLIKGIKTSNRQSHYNRKDNNLNNKKDYFQNQDKN